MICSKCKKKPVERFKKKCTECLIKNAQFASIYRQRNKDKISSTKKEKERRYIDKGLCRFCGIKLDDEIDGNDRCFGCRT